MATPSLSLSPIIHTFASPDLDPILARSNFSSLSHLLSAFETGVERVTIRSSTYESKLLPRFPVRFVERALPYGFGEAVGEGTIMHHRSRSGTVGSMSSPKLGGGLPHMPSALEPAPPGEIRTTVSQHRPTPSMSFTQPTPAERDELFLDSLSSELSKRADEWIGQGGVEELNVRGVKARRKVVDDEEVQPESEEGWEGRSLEQLTPWYVAMRDEVLKRREMVEWETFAQPVGVLIAISTSSSDPLGALSALWDLTSRENLFAPSSYPPRSGADEDGRKEWTNPDILRYIVLVHDLGAGGGRDGLEDAQTLHETLRKTYGHHTALLPIFSASPTAAVPQPRVQNVTSLWPASNFSVPSHFPTSSSIPQDLSTQTLKRITEFGQELSEDDLKNLRIFLREMVVQSLVPWLERAVVVGNEQFAASKRSIGGRLFSAGRKYFGGSGGRSGSPVSSATAPIGFNAIKGFYPFLAQESQTRRLADMAFMIGDYKLAASVYEQASKDYKTDKAWRYYSSACRMAGLSQLMLHPLNTPLTFNPDFWLELALQSPLAPGATGVVDLDGLQATMLYYEAYQAIGDFRPAVEGLVRTAGDVDEVSSAMLLEQAALSDLRLPRSSRRKYAFHMAMAAKRYEKTGLKSLSRRCLSQAASMYKIDPLSDLTNSTTWDGIRSHLHYGLGRQAYNVGKADEAVEHFLELLVGGGEHTGEGEESWLDDFGLAWEHLNETAERVITERNLKLHTTIFDAKDAHIRILLNGDIKPSVSDHEKWAGLAAAFAVKGDSTARVPIAEISESHEAVIGETFYLELSATNPLDAPLAIGGLHIDTDAEVGVVEIDAPQEIELAPRESLRIYVAVKATACTTFKFTQLSFRFNDLLPCTEPLAGKGKRLNNTREQLVYPTYKEDDSLFVSVRSPIPILSIALDELPDCIYAGEARVTVITLTNTGQVALKNLKGLCSHPSFAIFQSEPSAALYISSETPSTPTATIPNHLCSNQPYPIPLHSDQNSSPATLEAGASINISVLCRGDAQGTHELLWLFAFSGLDDTEMFTSRASCTLVVQPSLEIRPHIRSSNLPNTPFVLRLEVQNVGLPSNVVVNQISSLSPRWRCNLLDGSKLAEDLCSIGWQQSESVYLAVAALNAEIESEERGSAFAVRKIDDLLQGRDVKRSLPGSTYLHLNAISAIAKSIDTSLPALFTSIIQTHSCLRQASLSKQIPSIPFPLQQYLFPLFNARSIDLIVFWTAPSTGVSGHHHLSDIPIGASSNELHEVLERAELKAGGLYAESQRERSTLLASLRKCELGVDENPIFVLLEVEPFVEHDFEEGPCTIPVQFFVRNTSASLSFEYLFTVQPFEPLHSSSLLSYAGPLTYRGEVAPLDVREINASAWASRHGTYDVGKWELEITGSNGQSWRRSGQGREVRVGQKNT